ncbi:MAG: thermonuclease family protein [Spirochaetales bacterium]|nr:thermonuclease family protein [Spirochaetales bacterium]
MKKLHHYLYSLAIIAFLFAAPACGQPRSATEPTVYRVPESVTRIATLSGRVASMTQAKVERIVDGDTIVVSFGSGTDFAETEKVRLIGVDTPETVDPRKPVERFGLEASQYVTDRLSGRRVRLAFEDDLRDYYGRLLAYVFLEDGTCVNLDIVAKGYGFAYTKYPFIFMDDFREAERRARSRKLGLWG